MTLYRQLALFFALLLLITFCGVFTLSMVAPNTQLTTAEWLHSLTNYDYSAISKPLLCKLAALYLLVLVVTLATLKIILHPIVSLKKQAQAISRHQFLNAKTISGTREVRLISEAINTLSTNAYKKLKEETHLTERLHKQTYQDSVSGLGNRRYFDSQLKHLITEKIVLGALLLIELKGLKEFNDLAGYQTGDQLLKKIAEIIQDNCRDVKANFIARIGGSTFAILTPHLSEEEVSHLAGCLIQAIETSMPTDKKGKTLHAHIGIAPLAGVKNAAQALTFADVALKAAQEQGDYAFAVYENELPVTKTSVDRNASEWKKYIDQIINENLVTVAYQPIMRFPDKSIMAYESLLRVKGADSLTEARFIIPMADRYGLAYALDQCIIKQVLAKIDANNSNTPFLVNLSASILSHEPTLQWLYETLSFGKYNSKVIFEFAEHTVLNNLSAVQKVTTELRKHGVDFGIEHYGHDFCGFDYLKDLAPVYLKIDGSFIRDLKNQDTQFYINFLTKVTHTLGIEVLAECIETEDQWNLLSGFQLDAAQGRYLGAPEA